MADAPFDQTNIGLRERPTSGDINQLQSQIMRTIREFARAVLSPRASISSPATGTISGFIGDGFRAVPSSVPALSVVVSAGLGFFIDGGDVPVNIGSPDLEHVDDRSSFKPLFLSAPVTFAVPGPPGGGNSRIDIIEARIDRRLENAQTRRQLDVDTKSFLDHIFNKTLAYALDGRTGSVTNPAVSTAGISYKIGTPASVPATPATTSGYVKIAEVRVVPALTSVNGNDIVDRRAILGMNGVVNAALTWRQRWNSGAPIVDIISLVAPPGVQLGVNAENTTGSLNAGRVWVTGGEIKSAVVNIHPQRVAAGSDKFGVSIGLGPGNSGFTTGGIGGVAIVGTGNLGSINAAGIFVGFGQQIVGTAYKALIEDGSGQMSADDASLDDVVWNATFTIGYV